MWCVSESCFLGHHVWHDGPAQQPSSSHTRDNFTWAGRRPLQTTGECCRRLVVERLCWCWVAAVPSWCSPLLFPHSRAQQHAAHRHPAQGLYFGGTITLSISSQTFVHFCLSVYNFENANMQPPKTDIYLIHMGNIRIDIRCTYFTGHNLNLIMTLLMN